MSNLKNRLTEVLYEYEDVPVPENQRKKVSSIAFSYGALVTTASTIPIALSTAKLMSFDIYAKSLLLGFAFMVILAFLVGNIGAKTGTTTVLLFGRIFGKEGIRWFYPPFMAVIGVGWVAFHMGFMGHYLSAFFTNGSRSGDIIFGLIWGILGLLISIFGFKSLKTIAYIAVPIFVLTWVFFAGKTFSYAPNAISIAMNAVDPATAAFTLYSGLFLYMSFTPDLSVISSDFTRFTPTKGRIKNVILELGPMYLIIPPFLILVTVLMAHVYHAYDFVQLFTAFGGKSMVLLALIGIAVLSISTLDSWMYGVGLSISYMVKRPLWICLIGIAVVAMVVNFWSPYYWIQNWLLITGVFWGGFAGPIIVDYYLLRKKGKYAMDYKAPDGVIISPIIAALTGAVVSYFIGGATPLWALLISGTIYAVLCKTPLGKPIGKKNAENAENIK